MDEGGLRKIPLILLSGIALKYITFMTGGLIKKKEKKERKIPAELLMNYYLTNGFIMI